MTCRVLVVEPAPHAPVGRLRDWWEAAGLELDVVSPALGDTVPDRVDQQALVVMGGSMGANDEALYPWLADIKALLVRARAEELPTLGVCLGHQLLAAALGGTVRPNPAGITAGVRSVGLLSDAADDPLLGAVAPGALAVQWNDDVVVELPPGARLLAATPDGLPQAFRVGPRAWGVQFHPEATVDGVRDWADRDVADGSMPADRAADLLAGIERADAQLVSSWRPWAERFATLVSGRRPAER